MAQIEDILDRFSQMKVLVIGDLMVDRYLTGHINRISPEAPVPVVELDAEENRLGGAANVALNVQALGAEVHLCGVLGNDSNGRLFLDLMERANLESNGVVLNSERRTTVKTRIMSSGQQILRVDREDTHVLQEPERESFLEKVTEIIQEKDIDVLIFQDYDKGLLEESSIKHITTTAQNKQIPVVVDPKRKNFFYYEEADLFKPNLKEVRDRVPFEVEPTVASLQAAVDFIRARIHQKKTMITLSDEGLFLEEMGKGSLYPTRPRDIADVCGAGDTVVSIAALAHAQGLSPDITAKLANLGGGQVCEHVGVAPVDKDELLHEFNANKMSA